jgi:hypothetical protein
MAERRPTAEQLALINNYIPRDAAPLTAEEVVLFEFVGADNFLNRGGSKWHYTALQEIADRLPGLKLILDHSWGDVARSQALIYRAWVERSSDVPIEIIEAANNGRWNRFVLGDEGYITCKFDVAIRASSQLVDALRFGELGFISLGGFDYQDIWCPICNKSYYSEDCPHYIGYYIDDSKSELIMPYYERKGVTDLGEASIVVIPNLPGAKVV